MVLNIRRKDTISTIGEAYGWLRRNPVLLALFAVVGTVNAIGEVSILFAILGVILQLYAGGVAHLFARDELAGNRPDVSSASSRVLGRMLSLIGAMVMYTVIVGIGFILFIVPGIYMAVRLSLAFPACVIDRQNAFESLATSWEVARGRNLLKLLGISIVLVIITGVAIVLAMSLAIGLSGSEAAFYLVLTVFSAITTAVIGPIGGMAYARIYLENRSARTGTRRMDADWVDDGKPDWAKA